VVIAVVDTLDVVAHLTHERVVATAHALFAGAVARASTGAALGLAVSAFPSLLTDTLTTLHAFAVARAHLWALFAATVAAIEAGLALAYETIALAVARAVLFADRNGAVLATPCGVAPAHAVHAFAVAAASGRA